MKRQYTAVVLILLCCFGLGLSGCKKAELNRVNQVKTDGTGNISVATSSGTVTTPGELPTSATTPSEVSPGQLETSEPQIDISSDVGADELQVNTTLLGSWKDNGITNTVDLPDGDPAKMYDNTGVTYDFGPLPSITPRSQDVDLNQGVHLVRFFYSSCEPCGEFTDMVNKALGDEANKVITVIDEEPEAFKAKFPDMKNVYSLDDSTMSMFKYDPDKLVVTGVPYMIIVDNGAVVAQMTGSATEERLTKFLALVGLSKK